MRRFFLLMLLGGCVAELGVDKGTGITCDSDDDCPKGTTCDAEGKVCLHAGETYSVPRVTVSAAPGLTTAESGATATFSVVLGAAPEAEVRVPIAVDREEEGGASPAELVFDADDWSTPKTVTLHSVPDCRDDSDGSYVVSVGPAESDDERYDELSADDVEVTSLNDQAGAVVVNAAAPTVTENGGTASFTVVLACAPEADVTLEISSNDLGEGTVSPASITFTTTDWAQARSVTVTGIADCVFDGDDSFDVVLSPLVSADLAYAGVDAPDVLVTNTDAPEMGLRVSTPSSTMLAEIGADATFSLRLDCAPSADVVVTTASSNDLEVAVTSPANGVVTLTPGNWNVEHNLIVSSVDDFIDDDNLPADIGFVVTSADARFQGLDVPAVSFTTVDDDTAGWEVVRVGQHTNEIGATAKIQVTLLSAPVGIVEVTAVSLDPGEGEVPVTPLTFDIDNWLDTQEIIVTGAADDFHDGLQDYNVEVTTSSLDPLYDALTETRTFTNVDVDVLYVDTVPTSGVVTREDGISGRFSIRLSTVPTSDVFVPISSTDTDSGQLNQVGGFCTSAGPPAPTPCTLVINASNWDDAVVTITGVSDLLADGATLYQVIPSLMTSEDPDWDEVLDPLDVQVMSIEADHRRVFVTEAVYTGNLGGPSGADDKCNSDDARPDTNATYKALLVDGGARRACTSANCTTSGNAEHVDWVLQPDLYYTPADALPDAFLTNANAVFVFGTFTSSLGEVSPGVTVWTGLATNWTTASHCTSWTLASGGGVTGHSLQTNDAAISALLMPCNTEHHLLCIEQ